MTIPERLYYSVMMTILIVIVGFTVAGCGDSKYRHEVDATDVNKVCSSHGGVSNVSTTGRFQYSANVVCRDGTYFKVEGRVY